MCRTHRAGRRPAIQVALIEEESRITGLRKVLPGAAAWRASVLSSVGCFSRLQSTPLAHVQLTGVQRPLDLCQIACDRAEPLPHHPCA